MLRKEVLKFFKKLNYNTEDDKDGKNYRYFHPFRVLNLSQEIVKREKLANEISNNVLFLLALFHDIGRNKRLNKKHRLNPKEHDKNNILLFRKYISSFIKSKKDKDRLMSVVEDFSLKQYVYQESRIVSDADNLDEIGILNFWRMAVYAGKHHQDGQQIIDYYYNFDRRDKKEKMKNKLFFKSSRKIANARLEEMDKIMNKFKKVFIVNF